VYQALVVDAFVMEKELIGDRSYSGSSSDEEVDRDDPESVYNAFTKTKTRADKSKRLLNEYDQRMSFAVLKALHYVDQSQDELTKAQGYCTSLQQQLQNLQIGDKEIQNYIRDFEQLSATNNPNSTQNVASLNTSSHIPHQEQYIQTCIYSLSDKLMRASQRAKYWENEKKIRNVVLSQLEYFVGPILFWRNKNKTYTEREQKLKQQANLELEQQVSVIEMYSFQLYAEEVAHQQKQKTKKAEAMVESLQELLVEAEARTKLFEERDKIHLEEITKLKALLAEAREKLQAAEERVNYLQQQINQPPQHNSMHVLTNNIYESLNQFKDLMLLFLSWMLSLLD